MIFIHLVELKSPGDPNSATFHLHSIMKYKLRTSCFIALAILYYNKEVKRNSGVSVP